MNSRIIDIHDESCWGLRDGILIFDGDGDGAAAAAMYARNFPGTYDGVTNTQKGERDLVRHIWGYMNEQEFPSRVGIFDLAAEQNMSDLESLAKCSFHKSIDFVDHHTHVKLPEGINDLSEPDSRENCTASILYNHLLPNISDKEEATCLAVLGLANDGKDSAARKLGANFLPISEVEKIIKYGHALNYAANKGGIIDFIGVADGLTQGPRHYLHNSSEIGGLVELRESVIRDLASRIQKSNQGNVSVYEFPQGTEEDRELSRAVYSEVLNEYASHNSSSILAGIICLPDNNYRVAMRGPKVFPIANRLAMAYGKDHASGRDTAAGFDTPTRVNSSQLLTKIMETENEI